MKITLLFINVFYLLSLISCTTAAAFNETGDTAFSPDVQPIINGDWYRPALFVTWQWQLEGTVNTSYDVEIYDVDLFDTPIQTITELHSRGKKVICYFSAGSYENFRKDSDKFLAGEIGNPLASWQDEQWLDIRSTNVHAIMKNRLALAKKKGCDGVEPDNVDGFTNNSGFDLTASDQLAFNKFIANEAHRRGLSVGLKNNLEQLGELVDYYDFSVNEQCFEYDECNDLILFIEQSKPVLNAEYMKDYVADPKKRKALCEKSMHLQFSTLVLPQNLDDKFRFSCQ